MNQRYYAMIVNEVACVFDNERKADLGHVKMCECDCVAKAVVIAFALNVMKDKEGKN